MWVSYTKKKFIVNGLISLIKISETTCYACHKTTVGNLGKSEKLKTGNSHIKRLHLTTEMFKSGLCKLDKTNNTFSSKSLSARKQKAKQDKSCRTSSISLSCHGLKQQIQRTKATAKISIDRPLTIVMTVKALPGDFNFLFFARQI